MHLLLFILLYFTGYVFAQQPSVDCMVMNLEYVHCTWNGQGVPHVNYTFYSRFHHTELIECATYILVNSSVIGCQQPFEKLMQRRFETYYTKLKHGNNSFHQQHDDLKSKVKLNPPVNLTVINGTDFNLWFYWNRSHTSDCVESEIRYRTDYNNWETSKLSLRKQSFTINLPSSNYRYELQVKSRIDSSCAESKMWSDWSQPVFWGSMRENNSTDTRPRGPTYMQTLVVSFTSVFILFIACIICLQHERIRIILVPIIPNAGKNLDKILIDGNVEDWLPISKGLKEGFKANFNERACPVREYNRLPQSASESSDCSACSVTTNQTNCSVSIPADESECLSTSCSSSTSTLAVLSEEEQIHV